MEKLHYAPHLNYTIADLFNLETPLLGAKWQNCRRKIIGHPLSSPKCKKQKMIQNGRKSSNMERIYPKETHSRYRKSQIDVRKILFNSMMLFHFLSNRLPHLQKAEYEYELNFMKL